MHRTPAAVLQRPGPVLTALPASASAAQTVPVFLAEVEVGGAAGGLALALLERRRGHLLPGGLLIQTKVQIVGRAGIRLRVRRGGSILRSVQVQGRGHTLVVQVL